jgi:hypothetical protein
MQFWTIESDINRFPEATSILTDLYFLKARLMRFQLNELMVTVAFHKILF